MQLAVAARDAAIAASSASHPTPVKMPVGRPKVLAPLGVQAPPGERYVIFSFSFSFAHTGIQMTQQKLRSVG